MEVRFSRLPDGRILDIRPWGEHKPAVVLNVDGTWTPFNGTLGEIFDSKPSLTETEVRELSRYDWLIFRKAKDLLLRKLKYLIIRKAKNFLRAHPVKFIKANLTTYRYFVWSGCLFRLASDRSVLEMLEPGRFFGWTDVNLPAKAAIAKGTEIPKDRQAMLPVPAWGEIAHFFRAKPGS